ncbi:MAG: PD40 domain-containing protein [Deltaproteobacteria bacterium]|nr:PD40 domain-containing protein [Deltaproteobacteria bacterium]
MRKCSPGMNRLYLLGIALAFGCQAEIAGDLDDSSGPDGAPDMPADAGAEPDALVLGAWATPEPIPGAADATNGEDDNTLSSTATELIYAVSVPGGTTGKDLFVMTRPDTSSPWTAPEALTEFNTDIQEETPRLSPDDLTLYFGRGGDIYSSTRTAVGAAWSAPTLVDTVSTTEYEKWLAVCDGGRALISRYNPVSESQDLYEGTLADGAPTLVAGFSTAGNEISAFLTEDCLTAYYASNGDGEMQIYTATRATPTGPWSTPTLAPSPFNDGTLDEDAWISPDQRTFVFASTRDGATTKDLYISTR